MPYYNDVPYYYGGGSYANHSSLMTGTGRTTPYHASLSRFSPHLSTISESPYSHLNRFAPITVRHPRRVIDTADIDVSSPRILSQDGNRPRNRLRRNRPTIKIRSQALKDNPALRQHNERHEKSVGELLMEKFFIKDKKSDGDDGQQIRLYHQVSLDHLEDPQEALQRRVTRRFTRRRSSTDLQLDPEQLQREVAYAQVQAKVLDSLVAEEQAKIENETRRGTLIKKARGQTHSYYTNSADSDTMTHEEEEAAAARMRKTMKKTKKKKKLSVDKILPNEKIDDRRSSTSSEVSIDLRIENENDDNDDDARPQMYKIEACNSAGDFSTIWVNASPENEKRKPAFQQYKEESVRIPGSGEFINENRTATLSINSTDETETQVVLPVRKSYVKDPSRNSVYLTMRKPTEKLDEKLKKLEALDAKNDENQSSLQNGFAEYDILKDNSLEDLTSKDSSGSNGEMQMASDIKDETLKKFTDKFKKTKLPTKDVRKENVNSASNDEKSSNIVISTMKSTDVPEVDIKSAPFSSVGTATNSARSSVTVFNSTNAQKNNAEIKQSIPSKDTQRDKIAKNDNNSIEITMKSLGDRPDVTSSIKTPELLADKGTIRSEMDKPMTKEDKSKIPTMSRETSTRRNGIEVDNNAGAKSASSATFTPCGTTCRLPKPSKINADRNNAVEASELSLRETAEYLADCSRKSAENVAAVTVAALPGKKANKASNLAKISTVEARDVNGVDAVKSKSDATRLRDDAVKLVTKETTLLKETNGEVFNGEAKSGTDVKPITIENNTGKTDENAPRELSSETTLSKIEPEVISGTLINASREEKPLKTDIKTTADIDAGRNLPKDLSTSRSKVPKLNNAESKFPFKVKTFSKTTASDNSDAISPKIGKESDIFKITKVDNAKSISSLKNDVDTPKILKKSISVDLSSSNNQSSNSTSSNISKVLQQSTSVDEKMKNIGTPVKKMLEPVKLSSKVTEKKAIDADRDTLREECGQLSKSASTESIDFWSEITASIDPEATRPRQQSGFPFRDTAIAIVPKIEEKTEPAKRTSNDSPATPAKEFGDEKNEIDVKISVAVHGGPAFETDDPVVAAEKRKEEITVLESPMAQKAEVATTTTTTEIERNAPTVRKALLRKKKKNLSVTIEAKDTNSTVKKAPLKREDDSANSVKSESSIPDTAILVIPETPTPIIDITVPIINITEASKSSQEAQETDRRLDEEHEDPITPTNELPPEPSLTRKISRWSNQNDLTCADDVETPIASEETSLTASPNISPQSSKTKGKKKKASGKKTSLAKHEKGKKETRGANESNKQNTPAFVKAEKQLLAKPSPKGSPKLSPKNTPAQRPLDLIRMFYTTPSALLTATPRDLSKVRRAKIKRRRHHSRTPSVSSDSTGSTTSTATNESTDGSGSTCTEVDEDSEHKRMNSTRSNDSGFDGSPRISTCDMTCHKKCEKLTGNLCGLNQKLVAEALQALKKAPSQSSDNQRNSDSSDHFPSGRITPPATNLPRFKKYVVTDFNFLKVLGKGSFGKVLLAELRDTECVYAVKCLKKDVVLEDDDVECTLIERKVLTLATRHPYLCHLFCTFQTDSHLFFVMEYLNGGDLMFHIQKSGRFSETRARFYAAEIWSGLNFLHKKSIVYRDLKLDNVLLDFEGHIRIADFGMCKLQIFLDRTADTFCGTPDYMAPEIIKGLKYNQAVDWWSYGVLLYEMLTGQSPFSGCDEDELFWSICNERPFIPRYLSQEATDILVCLLEKDSGKRLPGHEIATHAFFQNLPWDRLERRQLEAPFKPALDHTLDTRYFDTAFTTERPRLTPVPEQILTSMDQGVFRGFSYTNPNATD